MTGFRARASLAAGLFLTAALTAAGVCAQPKPGRAAVFQRLVDCRAVSDTAARLACYDAAAAVLDQSEVKGDVVVVDRDQARAVRSQAFGFNLPSLNIFERDQRADPVDRVALKVEGASRGGDGKWILRLEGGQVWRQIDAQEPARYPRRGSTVVISRAALGSYLAVIDEGRPAIRVRREN